jgi:hypothetical protein
MAGNSTFSSPSSSTARSFFFSQTLHHLSQASVSLNVCVRRGYGEEEGNMRNRGEEGKKEERKGKGMCVRERERKRKGKERKE